MALDDGILRLFSMSKVYYQVIDYQEVSMRPIPDAVKEWASAARDVLALLFTPVVTLIAGWLIYILAYRPWAEGTQEQRINYLGAVAIIAVVLVGFGGQWFQRNRLEKLKLSGPGGFGGEIETEAEPTVTTTTVETEVKP